MRRQRPLLAQPPALLHAVLRAGSLVALVGSAVCGVKGPPRPPLGTEDQYGKRGGGDAGPCDNLEPPATVPVGKSTAAICEACSELRQKREQCGIKEPLGGRCKALCLRYDWKADLDPGQDVDARTQLMREWNQSHWDAGSEEDDQPAENPADRPDGGSAK